MSEEINDVLIVGGGDSGLLTALSIRQWNPGVDVAVVDDPDREIPQVGKSTYNRILDVLHGSLDIDRPEFVSEVKPIWKGSVYFRDWCGYPSFHFPFDDNLKFPEDDHRDAIERYYHHYDELYDSPDHLTKGEQIVEKRKTPIYFVPREGGYRQYERIAYHLNTKRFNSFLRDLCRERDIRLLDDEIVDVDVSGDRIERVRSKSQAYESDLYVDATGFDRHLKRRLGSEFVDFDFPLDSALNARVDRPLSEVVPATVIDSGEYGWFWQIDTYDNRDLGYVFASEYASDDEAMAEFLDHCDGDLSADDVTAFEFTSGYYDRAWEGNCIAIGNAGGFVEPLQSTGLTANAEAAVVLGKLLSSHGRINDEWIRETFNSWVRRTWESIYDFISIHYKYADGDNEFWRAMQSIPTTERVERLVEEFDRNGFGREIDPTENEPGEANLRIFLPVNFYVILRNMGETSAFYETNEFDVSDEVKRKQDEFYREIADDVENHLSLEEVYDLHDAEILG